MKNASYCIFQHHKFEKLTAKRCGHKLYTTRHNFRYICNYLNFFRVYFKQTPKMSAYFACAHEMYTEMHCTGHEMYTEMYCTGHMWPVKRSYIYIYICMYI